MIHWMESLWDAIPIQSMFVPLCIATVCSVASFAYTAWNSPKQRLSNSLAALAVIAFAVVCWFAAFPLADRLRRSRHYDELNQHLPALNALVCEVESFRESEGRTPTNDKFAELESGLQDKNEDFHALYNVKDWGFDYRRMDDQHFQLIYFSMDVRLMYDSALPRAGWVPVREEAGRYVPTKTIQ